jgi:outer membrane protein OmpA-like peptidoglycan-associated protein
LLSDGQVLREIELIARERAEELAAALHKIGVPGDTQLSVRWESEAQMPDGVMDPERRRAEIRVQP